MERKKKMEIKKMEITERTFLIPSATLQLSGSYLKKQYVFF